MVVRGGQLEVLTKKQIYDIHMASLDVLEHTGVIVREDEALRVLDEAGAAIDYRRQHARIPPYLVEEAIRRCPSGLTLYGRDRKKRIKLEDGNVHFAPAGGPYVLDLDGKRRPAVWDDVANITRLTDGLENLDVAGAFLNILGVSEWEMAIRRFIIYVRNAEKPLQAIGVWRSKDLAEDSIKMQSAVAGGLEELKRKPMMWFHVNPVSPLIHDKQQTEGMLVYAKQGLPIHFGPEIVGGGTGPVTLGGILVQQNVENLSGITMAQMAADPKSRPPVVYATVSGVMDMKTTCLSLGCAEAGLINIATAQIARYYGLPSRGAGGMADSKIPDAQAGYETATTLLMAAMGGINYIVYSAGGLEPGILTVSYEKFVMDNDMIGMVKRALEGIDINDETLAVDVIGKVGPGGHFLSQEHTKKYYKREVYYPAIFNRATYQTWVKAGSRDLREMARDRAKKILKEHFPEPLDKDIETELERIAKEVEKREIRRETSKGSK